MIPYSSKIPYDYESRRRYIDVPFPEEEYRECLAKVRRMMQENALSGLIVYSYPSGILDRAGHLSYLTSFRPKGGDAALLLPVDGEPTLVFERVFHGEPMHSNIWTTWVEDVIPSRRDDIPANVEAWARERKMEKGRVGVVGEQMLPWDLWNNVRVKLPHVEWVPASKGFTDIQKVKSEREMKLIREVCTMTNEGMRAGLEAVKPGVSEGEVLGEIHREFARQGAHDFSFDSNIASGPRGGLKHCYPTRRRLERGDLVYVDVGARYYGYHTDMSRVVTVGKPNDKQKEFMGHVRNAYYTLLDGMKPGVPVSDLKALAKELEERSGVSERYGKEGLFMGFASSHGMSTGYAEWSLEDGRTVISPNLSPLAFEPMIIVMEFGTVVIESMIGFTGKGAEVLTPLKVDWM